MNNLTLVASITMTAGLATTVYATPQFSWIASNAAHVSPIGESDGLNLIVEDRDGSFHHYNYNARTEKPQIPGANAVLGKGMAAVANFANGGTYVFEIEQSGLYYTRSMDAGAHWNGWCHVDARNDLVSAPAVVFLDYGFAVFARTSTNTLQAWGVDTLDSSCADGWYTYTLGTTTAAPVATSWGPGRFDVFGRSAAGTLEHFWGINHGQSVGTDVVFTVNGTNVDFPLSSTIDNIAVMSEGLNRLDIVFRERTSAGDVAKRLAYRGAWSVETVGSGAGGIVTVGTEVVNGYGTLWLATVCQNTSSTCYVTGNDENRSLAFGETFSSPSNLQELRSVHNGTASLTYAIDSSGILYYATNDTF